MKKYRFLAWALTLSIIVVLSACGSNASKPKTGAAEATQDESKGDKEKTIRIGYQKGNTINILKESGFLEEELESKGYSVEWREFVHGNAIMEGIFTNAIDFGHAADGAGINAQVSKKPFYYVGADLPNPEGVGILVHKEDGIESIADLKGKKIGALRGGNHHYLALLAVEEAGLSLDDVEWVYLQDASQMRTAFETKNIDALATYDPFFAGTELSLDTINLTEGKDYGYPNRTFYYSSVDFYDKNPELVELILDAIDRSDQWANENKPEVVKLVAEMLGLEETIIDRALNRREYAVERLNDEIRAAQQKQADIYYDVDLIPMEIDVSENMIFE